MTVKEALEYRGITKLAPKFKVRKTDERYGEIICTQGSFPKPYAGAHHIDARWGLGDPLFNKLIVRSRGLRGGRGIEKTLNVSNLFFGWREPGWNGEDARPYYIAEDFIRTFWGQKALDEMAVENIKPFAERKTGVLTVYFDPETRLTVVDGEFCGIPASIFIAPTDIPNSI